MKYLLSRLDTSGLLECELGDIVDSTVDGNKDATILAMTGVHGQLRKWDGWRVAWKWLGCHKHVDHETALGESCVHNIICRFHARCAVIVDGFANARHN